MNSKPTYQQQFDHWQCCVLIPTYNNAPFLKEVLDSVLEYTSNLIVVNDGATDETAAILAAYPQLTIIHHPENKGKGPALQNGFDAAWEAGYTRVITMDSDSQHRASDLPNFLEALEKHPNAFMVGARNMDQENVPGASSFGHWISNTTFHVVTGLKLPDTQSGYRLYPLKAERAIRFYSGRYEYEMEAVVRITWSGVETIPVPIDVYYPPKEERISHFRKIPDFTRITIINSIFVVIGLLYVRPMQFLRNLKKKNIKKFLKDEIINGTQSNAKITHAVMLGLFMGVTPFWGWQMILTVFFSGLLKVNKVIALIAAQISLPPMIPFIIYGSYKIGGVMLNQQGTIPFDQSINLSMVGENLLQYVVGSFGLGILLAAVSGPLVYLLLLIFRRKESSRTEREKYEI